MIHIMGLVSPALHNSQKVNEMRVGDSETTFHAGNDAAGRFSLARHIFEH